MQIVLNGEAREIPDGASIVALLEHLGIERQRVAVELNELVVPRAKHASTTLKPTDRVEIVTFVGGG